MKNSEIILEDIMARINADKHFLRRLRADIKGYADELYKEKIDFDKLQEEIDTTLESETEESLKQFLSRGHNTSDEI